MKDVLHSKQQLNSNVKIQMKYMSHSKQFSLEKETYLYLFDSQSNGPIHVQEGAKKIWRTFINNWRLKVLNVKPVTNHGHYQKSKRGMSYLFKMPAWKKMPLKNFQLIIIWYLQHLRKNYGVLHNWKKCLLHVFSQLFLFLQKKGWQKGI